MKKPILYIIGSFMVCICGFNCSSGGSDPDPKTEEPPGAANLIFPGNNSECTEGSNVSSTESTITFDWYDANNTSSYQLFIKNLKTQSIENYNTSTSQISVTLLRGTPYSWYVISKNVTTQTAQSNTWKFYNAGDPESSYAPFPAELVAPLLYAKLSTGTTSVLLDWNAEDVDNDIKEFDLYFDVTTPPNTRITTTSDSNFSVSVSGGNTYYWRIITKDNQNNSSESQIFQFSVE
ncbi:hypothetical protein [Aestuariivivens sediminis]|uniref:hypothetical protein n=1 Tax=Aestuariivivens sediminis TaxID=2913557 RepID=UPI001F57B45E|nr:hypothetical protein [Aestuariivivens sediminis]